MSAPFSAIDRAALDQSLLMATVKLFALAAKADEVVSELESSYVWQYFSRSYPREFTDFLHQEFLRYVEKDLVMAEVTAQCRQQQSYEERVFLLGKLMELLAADEITEEEWAFWTAVGEQMGLEAADLRRLAGLWQGSSVTSEEGYSDYLRWLWITGKGEGGEVELASPGLKLLVLRVKRRVFLKQLDGPQAINLEGRPLLSGLLWRLPTEAAIEVAGQQLRPLDLKFLFRRLGQPEEEHRLTVHGEHLLPVATADEPHFCLRLQGPRLWLDPGRYPTPLYLGGEGVNQPRQVAPGEVLQVGSLRLPLRDWLLYQRHRKTQFRTSQGQGFSIGNQYECDIQIDDDLEQPWTCRIEAMPQGYEIHPEGCPYHVWLNGERLRRRQAMGPQDQLRILQTDILWDAERQVFRSQENSLQRLEARGLGFAFPDGTQGLDQVSFAVKRGELVGILGPSGSGKSTLLNLINGYHEPQEGQILIDSRNLHQHFDRFKDRMGFVPQDDLLFENLTVYENLYFNARLRYPDRVNDIDALVTGVLRDIGLLEQRNLKVGSPAKKIISGGQRKRLNIGLELLAENELMMFDEPTSGLSSKDSERILRLIKQLALRGKLIFVVIHQPSSRLYQLFDQIILLDRGGKLAFFGEKEEALGYFEAFDPQEPPKNQAEADRLNPELLLDTVEQPLQDLDGSSLHIRRYAPEFWQAYYQAYRERQPLSDGEANQADHPPHLPWQQPHSLGERWSIFRTLVRRNFFNKLRDRSNLLVTFLIPPTLALLVGLILRYQDEEGYTLFNNLHLTTFLFLAVLIAIFLGVTNSVEEIIRDQRILLRERMLDVSRVSYYFAKVVTLGGFAVVQNLLFLGVGFLTLELKELFGAFFAVLMLTSLSGITLGLFVSSLPGLSAKGAVNLVPIMLIPQIIFGGALVEYKKMNQQLTVLESSPIPEICQVMPSRWGFEALVTLQGFANRYHPQEDSMIRDLNDYRRYQREEILSRLLQETGSEAAAEEAYEAGKRKREQALEAFRQRYRDAYGNRILNQAVTSAQKDYERQIRETGSPVYPLFVPKKTLPFTQFTLPTPLYNALVMLAIIAGLAGGGLLMLYRRF